MTIAMKAAPKLEQESIVAEALGLLDEAGLDGLNLRALADRLSVKAPALYWHVSGKAELQSLMAAFFYRTAVGAVTEAGDWRRWLIAFGRAFRGALLSHRDSARLCAIARPVPPEQDRLPGEALAAPLVAMGIAQDLALSFQASVIALTLGWVVYEQSDAMHDHLTGMIDFDVSFDRGLIAMVGGFDAG